MKRFFNMPPQVFRLFLLAAAIVVSYSTARAILTPSSFRQYGWYRGDALTELRARDTVYAGKKACEACHKDQYQKLLKYEHKTLSCESCHGPNEAHAVNPDIRPEKSNYGVCLRCHEANPSRPKWHKQIVSKNHYSTGSKCSECHQPHAPSEVP